MYDTNPKDLQMIKTNDELKFYLEQDNIANGRNKLAKPRRYSNSSKNQIHKFLILLRKVEYYEKKKSLIKILYFNILKYKFNRLSVKLGFFIMPNVFGHGLAIAHSGPIIVNDLAKIGKNCRISVGVNIGINESINSKGGIDGDIPKLGDNIYIGPGAKIFGKIIIANNIAIGANAVVTKSFLEENITIAGVPAKKISNKGTIKINK